MFYTRLKQRSERVWYNKNGKEVRGGVDIPAFAPAMGDLGCINNGTALDWMCRALFTHYDMGCGVKCMGSGVVIIVVGLLQGQLEWLLVNCMGVGMGLREPLVGVGWGGRCGLVGVVVVAGEGWG